MNDYDRLNVLFEARALFEDHGGAKGFTSRGNKVCAIGAIGEAVGLGRRFLYASVEETGVPELMVKSSELQRLDEGNPNVWAVARWNDKECNTKECILELFDMAIADLTEELGEPTEVESEDPQVLMALDEARNDLVKA